jgi:hypothetical protein
VGASPASEETEMKKLFDTAFGLVLYVGLILVLGVTGVESITRGLGERKLDEAPTVALAELAAHAGKAVRVRARISGEPALFSAGGERLAFQAVTVTHNESSGSGEDRSETTVTDYARTAPEILLASDGGTTVGVLTQGVDLRFVPERFQGTMGGEGALPPGAASLVSSSFTGFPERAAADLSVRAIPDGAEVSILGTVQVVDGQPVLQAADGVPFVVTPLPFEQVLKEAGSSGVWNLAVGAALLLGSLALAASALRDRFRGQAAA